jgi:hypothetical protein
VEAVEAKRARRRKREKEKREKQGDGKDVVQEEEEEEKQGNGWLERVTDCCVMHVGGKVRGLSLVESDDGSKGIQVRLSHALPFLAHPFAAPPLTIEQPARVVYHPNTTRR